jgi:uncharacterized protein (DUF1697 family)
MTRLVALLRGVNVGGVAITMADLAELVAGLGFTDVKTVLASGNVLFTTTDAASAVKSALEAALRARFGYNAWVHVLTVDPFPRESGRHAYVVFAMTPEVRAELLAVPLDPEVEQAEEGDGVVYWSVPKGSTLDSALGKAQAKPGYQPWLTTRNVNSLEKMVR